MKAEHRHELKTNELADWIGHLPQWARENRTTIIIVVAVVVVAAALYFWRDYDKNVVQVRRQLALTSLINQLPIKKMQILQSHSQGTDDSFILLSLAGELQTFAQEAKDNRMAALALIKQAQAVRTELHYRVGEVSKQELMEQTGKAKASYTGAIGKASDCPSLLAVARFGLGLCEEELGDFDKAEQIYRDIVADPRLAGTTAKAAAEHRLETMNDYKTNVVFKPAPVPQIPTTPVSPLEIRPSDVNLPIEIELGPAAPNSTSEVLEPNSSGK